MSTFTKRTHFIINRKFQFSYVLFSLIPLVLILMVIFAALKYHYHEQILFGQNLQLPPNHAYFVMVEYQTRQLNKIFWILTASVTTVLIAWSLFISHRIAGPLYRMTKFFSEHGGGNGPVPQFKFRPGDFFQEIPAAFNLFAERLNTRLGKSDTEIK